MRDNNNTTGREAIAVGRFSSDAQDQGDSRQRQEKTFLVVCRKWHLEPSTRFSIFDSGKSAYHGCHLKADAEFGQFLVLVRAGKVPSIGGQMPVLVWEAVDRFSRMGGFDATDILREIVNAGFALLFDDDDLFVDAENIDDVWAELQSAIHAARKYSKRLARKMRSSWNAKRNSVKARHHCPRWLRWNGQDYEVIEEEKKIIVDVAKKSIAGHGVQRIRNMLGLEKYANLAAVLRSRTLLGEYQPRERLNHNRDKRAVGAVKIGYYPAVLDETTFNQLQVALDSRRNHHGRRGKYCTNLFTNLIKDAADGERMVIFRTQRKMTVLRSRACKRVKGCKSIHYDVVEKALLQFLLEIEVSDLVPAVAKDDGLAALQGQLAGLQHEANGIMQSGFGDGGLVAQRLHKLEKDMAAVSAEIEKVKRSSAYAEKDRLEDVQTVIGLLGAATGEELLGLRLRLRDCIAALVSEIRITVESSTAGTIDIFKTGDRHATVFVGGGFPTCGLVGGKYGVMGYVPEDA